MAFSPGGCCDHGQHSRDGPKRPYRVEQRQHEHQRGHDAVRDEEMEIRSVCVNHHGRIPVAFSVLHGQAARQLALPPGLEIRLKAAFDLGTGFLRGRERGRLQHRDALGM